VNPPNNNGYERTLCWTKIEQAVAALTPFVDMTAAKSAGFDITKPYIFQPFMPTLPSQLGAFVSFKAANSKKRLYSLSIVPPRQCGLVLLRRIYFLASFFANLSNVTSDPRRLCTYDGR
jgi:hypothetical protein